MLTLRASFTFLSIVAIATGVPAVARGAFPFESSDLEGPDRLVLDRFSARLAACSAHADREGVFGDAIVSAKHALGARTIFSVATSGRLGPDIARCARDALEGAVGELAHDAAVAGVRLEWAGSTSRPHRSTGFAIGSPRPRLPPLADLIHAIDDPRARRQAGNFDPSGCVLVPWTPNEQRALSMWIQSTGRAADVSWLSLFDDVAVPGNTEWRRSLSSNPRVRGHGAIIWAPPEMMVLDRALPRADALTLGTAAARLCKISITDSQRRQLSMKIAEAGRCWMGDLDAILLHRQMSFPDRTYVAIDAAVGRACAVDGRGGIECCGHIGAPPPGPFASVKVGNDHACASRPDGSWVCWEGRLPQSSKPDTPQGCRLEPDGRISCRGGEPSLPPALATAKLKDVRGPAGSHCGLLEGGSVLCWGIGWPRSFGSVPDDRPRH